MADSIFYIAFNEKKNHINIHNRTSKSQSFYVAFIKNKKEKEKKERNNRRTESVRYPWPRRRGRGYASRRPRWEASSWSRTLWTRSLRRPSTAAWSRRTRRAPTRSRSRLRSWPPPTRTPPWKPAKAESVEVFRQRLCVEGLLYLLYVTVLLSKCIRNRMRLMIRYES